MRLRRLAALVACALLAPLVAVLPATSAERPATQTAPPADDTREVGPDYNGGRPIPIEGASVRPQPKSVPDDEGDTKQWLALDDVEGSAYLKDYTLRAEGEHAEVWVANEIAFPEGDCRNDERVVVTDEQAQYLLSEFDTNIYPKESEAFSVAPDRAGTNADTAGLGLPDGYYETDRGDRTVVLVDNVRDDNYYEFPENPTYIAGFFFSLFNELHDRNIMTIDAYDWVHRTGENPPNEPVPGDDCASKPARPLLYEGVFAHEYQHLLEYYEDPDETTWVNEGLSDWAQTLTGYVDPSLGINDTRFDSHIQCFLGNLGIQTPANPNPRAGGPENSLTGWEDQGADEVLCDYGAVYTMMEYLHGLYGTAFMSDLHRNDSGGLEGLQELLDTYDPGTEALDIVHRWAAMVALDRPLDRNRGFLLGGRGADYRTPTLDAAINFETPEAYDTPGAPPNGSDYVRFRNQQGSPLRLSNFRSLSFDGAEELAPRPLEWTVDPEARPGDPALYSGSGPNLDRAAVTEVTVPAGDPTLTFDTMYDIEEGWDFGFVQVSTDGGQTYTSLPGTTTTTETDPGAIPVIQDNVPGYTGNSGGFITETVDLSAYAGQDILLSFRYVTDPAVDLPGWWVDNVAVGGELLSDGSSTEGFQSATEINPVDVQGWTVQVIAYSTRTPWLPAGRIEVPLGEGNQLSVDASRYRRLFAFLAAYDVVAAIVTHDDPTETVTQYANYTLTVNGVTQPGGS